MEYLVKWKNRPIVDSTWIYQFELDLARVIPDTWFRELFLSNLGCLMQEHLGFMTILDQPKYVRVCLNTR